MPGPRDFTETYVTAENLDTDLAVWMKELEPCTWREAEPLQIGKCTSPRCARSPGGAATWLPPPNLPRRHARASGGNAATRARLRGSEIW
jgi:hypothetical protein